MRRMYTTQGIQKLIDDSIDDAFENIDDQDIGNGLFEKIKDKDGHLRFIEGNLEVQTIPGVTFSYAKWSLSGSHLMLVLSGTIANTTAIASTQPLAVGNLPNWIFAKIPIIWSSAIDNKSFKVYANDWTSQDFGVAFMKQSSYVSLISGGDFTATADRGFKFQFDLIIDNA